MLLLIYSVFNEFWLVPFKIFLMIITYLHLKLMYKLLLQSQWGLNVCGIETLS